ncbi:MAG: sigma-70 family RNA polymerase sigma factor [Nocardioidaceae bacterium]|nr:sigma-70 family RNA polymerase sigma factor [Nocardioidaceae bacterium]NUS51613.1 sigma-70 family RNA polymerase sigma factor [Nocardioidaceae bacterium]
MNLPVARSIARRYCRRGIDREDLEQVAAVGLVHAAQHFDADRHKDFLSYAVPTVRGHVRRHFRDAGWAVRPPRRLQELEQLVSRTAEELTQELGRSPRPQEIADRLDADVDEVVEALTIDDRGCFTPTHYDDPLRAPGGPVADDPAPDGSEAAEARLMLAPAVKTLSERDRLIVRMRFFEGCTQSEIGRVLGVTQMQVSRLLTRILDDLRDRIDEPLLL